MNRFVVDNSVVLSWCLDEDPSLGAFSGLTTYDASYLELAIRTGLPIATLHKALTKAARKVRVPLSKP